MKKKKIHHRKVDHEGNLKAIVSLLIVFLAFTILVIFSNFKDSIIEGGMFKPFMYAAGVGMIFFVGLLYLVNKQK